MKLDLKLWRTFLYQPEAYSRPFIDLNGIKTAKQLNFYTDASRNYNLGCGGCYNKEWFALQWDNQFMQLYNPSINYLELYALVVGLVLWMKNFKDERIIVYCDNMSVVHMVNKNTSSL